MEKELFFDSFYDSFGQRFLNRFQKKGQKQSRNQNCDSFGIGIDTALLYSEEAEPRREWNPQVEETGAARRQGQGVTLSNGGEKGEGEDLLQWRLDLPERWSHWRRTEGLGGTFAGSEVRRNRSISHHITTLIF